MGSKLDDLEAVRTLVSTLEAFEKTDQERIIRWAREKLGLSVTPAEASIPSSSRSGEAGGTNATLPASEGQDIKTFVAEKAPASDVQFAATVAYYYRFEAPQMMRKEAITSNDLQDATRQTGRARLNNPGQTLLNAHKLGFLDKTGERGTYTVNTVGENLVAMTLPTGGGETRPPRKSKPKKKTKKKVTQAKAKKKTVVKKTPKKR